jgi:hypothetical protein
VETGIGIDLLFPLLRLLRLFVHPPQYCYGGRAAKHTIGLNFRPARAMLSEIYEAQ